MTVQTFDLYTKNGYAGDLVDSGPRVIQTGILVPNATAATTAGFGKAMLRQVTGTLVERGVELGGATNVHAISQREYNHEAGSRPSTGDDTVYNVTESVSLIRQGFLYIKLTGATNIVAGQVLHVDTVTGEFSKLAVSGNVVATTNVVAEESAIEGEVFKVRIDIK